MKRGEVWWASLPPPTGSGPGFRRPVVVVQSNPFNQSRIATVVVAIVTSNLALADSPGNVRASEAVERSVRTVVGTREVPPELSSGYSTWRAAVDAGRGGVFNESVSKAIEYIAEGLKRIR